MIRGAMGMALLSSCAAASTRSPRPDPCHAVPTEARPFRPADSTALVGQFELVMVTENWPTRQVTRAELRLWPNPPVRHKQLARFGHRRGTRPIAGAAMYPGGQLYNGAPDDHTTAEYPAVELLDSTLYLGSPDPTDAIYTALHIERIDQTGFWGRFGTSEGFEITIDSSGQELPEAQGHFCATRRSGA